MFEIKVLREFSAAHQLRQYQGACENLHGHNFEVEVTLRAETNDDRGMVTDFHEIERVLEQVLAELDHKFLNQLPPFKEENPTSENLARHIARRMQQQVAGRPCRVARVEIWESPRCSATYLVEA